MSWVILNAKPLMLFKPHTHFNNFFKKSKALENVE